MVKTWFGRIVAAVCRIRALSGFFHLIPENFVLLLLLNVGLERNRANQRKFHFKSPNPKTRFNTCPQYYLFCSGLINAFSVMPSLCICTLKTYLHHKVSQK
jgi:hypothetical protein